MGSDFRSVHIATPMAGEFPKWHETKRTKVLSSSLLQGKSEDSDAYPYVRSHWTKDADGNREDIEERSADGVN